VLYNSFTTTNKKVYILTEHGQSDSHCGILTVSDKLCDAFEQLQIFSPLHHEFVPLMTLTSSTLGRITYKYLSAQLVIM
jgi:hypothetical protein